MALDLSSLQTATGSPSALLNDAIDAGVQGYLNTTLSRALAHQVAMGVLGGTSFMHTMLVRAKVGGVLVVSHKVGMVLDDINKALQTPNIEGISIYAARTTVGREVEVSSTPVIQQSISARKYVSDSATPMPRTFSISGYIQSMQPGLDYGTTIRPSIVAQAKYLDSCAASRCPVWYKDDYNRFFLVLITRFNEEHDPSVTNVLKVDIEMTEYVPYVAEQVVGNSFMVDGMNTIFRRAINK